MANSLAEVWRVSRLSLDVLRRMAVERGPRAALGFAWLGFSRALQGRALPHTPDVNRLVWTHYDWSRGGQEWSESPGWTASVVEHLLHPHVPVGSRVLEIGPGAGRWTEYLVPRASRLVLVDVTPKCIELCRQRFQTHGHVEYVVTDGADLGSLTPGSIDRIWCWDVFIHVQVQDQERYLRRFAAVLAPGGAGLVLHTVAPYARGWRSVVTSAQMAQMCRAQGLAVVRQFNTWGDGRWTTPTPRDLITVFARP